MPIIKYSFDTSALTALRRQEELIKKLQIENHFSNLAIFQQNKFAEIMEPLTSQMEQYRHMWNSTFRDQYDEILRPLQETLAAYNAQSLRLYDSSGIAQSLNILRSELCDSFKVPELVQVLSAKWEDYASIGDLPEIDLFIDTTANTLTDRTAATILDLSSLDIDDFDYSIDEEGFVHLSEPLENVVTNVFDSTMSSVPREKMFSREFFYNIIFPFLLMLIPLVVSLVQDNQQTELQISQHQEQMAVYREILYEEEQQTEIAHDILEEERKQTEYLKIMAEQDN